MKYSCQGLTRQGNQCQRITKGKYCYQHKGGTKGGTKARTKGGIKGRTKGGTEGGTNNNFVMFNEKERQEIMKDYNDIVMGTKRCLDYPMDKVLKASSGMYIYPKPIPEKKGKDELCDSINKSHKKGEDPIVHEDSITAWGNWAAENYGLEVGDILKMKPVQKMDLILMDRNVGDYIDSKKAKKGDKFNPKKDGFTYATYTHRKGLEGKLDMYEIGTIDDKFQWEINLHGIGKNMFWGPLIPKNYPLNQLDPRIKVGWRGPAIRMEDAKYLPDYFVYYDTWWDDYLPFRTHDFLKLSKNKNNN